MRSIVVTTNLSLDGVTQAPARPPGHPATRGASLTNSPFHGTRGYGRQRVSRKTLTFLDA